MPGVIRPDAGNVALVGNAALVVEDDADCAGLLGRRLRRVGFHPRIASSAEEALAVIADRGAPDIAVLDVGLPGMDGLSLLESIRSRPGLTSFPAVFLSARVLPDDVAKGRAMGATYLTKPFVASALLNAVDQALTAASDGNDHDGW